MKVEKTAGKILFKETQQFRQRWLWIILLFGAVVSYTPIIALFFIENKVNAATLAILFVTITAIIGANIAVFYFVKLETVITTEGIYYRWLPMFRKFSFFAIGDLTEIAMVKYPYLKYGYHRNKVFGKVHNVNGNLGFRFKLKDKQLIFLGTQKPAAVKHILEKNFARILLSR